MQVVIDRKTALS